MRYILGIARVVSRLFSAFRKQVSESDMGLLFFETNFLLRLFFLRISYFLSKSLLLLRERVESLVIG